VLSICTCMRQRPRPVQSQVALERNARGGSQLPRKRGKVSLLELLLLPLVLTQNLGGVLMAIGRCIRVCTVMRTSSTAVVPPRRHEFREQLCCGNLHRSFWIRLLHCVVVYSTSPPLSALGVSVSQFPVSVEHLRRCCADLLIVLRWHFHLK